MKGFWDFVRDFRSVGGWAGKSAVAAPFLALLLQITPAWPTRMMAASMAAMVELLVVAVVFESWNARPMAVVRKRFRLTATMGAVAVAGYIVLHVFFVYAPSDFDPRYVESGWETRGIVVQPRIRPLIEMGRSVGELLEDAQFNPLKIWEPWSVYTMRAAVFVTWLLLFAALSASIGAFVLLHRSAGGRGPVGAGR